MNTSLHLRSVDSQATRNNRGGDIIAKYDLAHNNGVTILEQTLCLTRTSGDWAASIDFSDFPPQPDLESASIKLAEWMERMALALRENPGGIIDLNQL